MEITDRKPQLTRKNVIHTKTDLQVIGIIGVRLHFLYQTNILVRSRGWQTIHADMGKI